MNGHRITPTPDYAQLTPDYARKGELTLDYAPWITPLDYAPQLTPDYARKDYLTPDYRKDERTPDYAPVGRYAGSSGDTVPNFWGEFREIRESKQRTGIAADVHRAGTPRVAGVERLLPRKNGQRLRGGKWEGTD